MMNSKRGKLLLVALCVLSLLLLPIAGVAAEKKVFIGAFDLGPGGAPESFNPLNTHAGHVWFSKYFSRLVVMDKDFTRYFGDLARDWEVSKSGTVWTFNLRKDVYWHDGQPFTADDVEFSFKLYLNPATGSVWVGDLGKIKGAAEFSKGKTDRLSGVRVVDKYTVEVELIEPFAPFLDILAREFFVLPRHALKDIPPEQLAKHPWWRTNPIGTGPFQWVKYVPGQYTELRAYDNYYLGRPKLDGIINRYYADVSTAVAALEAGEIDFTYINPSDVERLARNSKIRVISGPSLVVKYIQFNLNDPLFQDVRVRKAFNYAIDRKAIVENLFKGQAQVMYTVYGQPFLIPEDLIEYEYDPQEARKLLSEAGWDPAKVGPIELITYYNSEFDKNLVEAIQAYLAQVGITIKPRFLDVPTYERYWYDGDFQLNYRGVGYGPDPDTAVRPKWHSKGAQNVAGYNFPELDEGLEKGLITFGLENRAKWYKQVARVLNHEATDIFLWVDYRHGAVNKRVKNFVWMPAPAGARYFDYAHEWSK